VATFKERLIGAARFDVHVYEEVEGDSGATGEAMGVVLLSSLAGGIGSIGLGAGLGGVVLGAVAALLGWVTWAFLTYFIGTRLLAEPQTHADVGELMRTLGFAQSPGLLRIAGVFFTASPALFSLFQLVVSTWMLMTMVVAVRQALDYTSTMRAVGVVLVGFVANMIILSVVVGMLGS